jgi:hypothetical protein
MDSKEIHQLLVLAYLHSDDHYQIEWESLFNKDRFVKQIASNIIKIYQDERIDFLSPPNPSFETTPKLSALFRALYQTMVQYRETENLKPIIRELNNLGPKILYLIGLRSTAGTEFSKESIPPDDEILLEASKEKYNNKLTVAARSWSKHAFKCESNYWPQIRGNPDTINDKTMEIIENLLDNKTWWNVFGHFKHDFVYEIRDKTGHGARWSIDGNTFIGFVEPLDPESGLDFRD